MLNTCLFFFLLLLNLGALNVHLGFVVGCHESERAALLKFKQSLVHLHKNLSSWEGMDCCKWEGVGCDNVTTHIIHLDLHNPYYVDYDPFQPKPSFLISPRLDSSLVELRHLNHLDLSNNDFQESQIPVFVGSFKHLRYLNLSYSNFSGDVPSQLGNLTKLNILDLSSTTLSYNYMSMGSDLDWVSNLVSLQYLNMGGIYISQSRMMFPMPPSLSSIRLSHCGLATPHLFSIFSNSTWVSKIQQLDLSENFLEGPLPHYIANMTSLTHLDLSLNQLNGSLPRVITNMTSLTHLNLAGNQLNGSLPRVITNMTSLTHLDLACNGFNNPLDVIANMTSLTYLDLSRNQLNGSLPHVIVNTTSLTHLHLSGNNFKGSISLDTPNMQNLEYLDLSSNSFNGVEGGAIMGIIGNICKLKTLDLSYNSIEGIIGANHNLYKCVTYDLEILHLGNNTIGGTLPQVFSNFTSLTDLDLSGNNLRGSIPLSMRNMRKLEQLDLSYNFFTGFEGGDIMGILGNLCKLNTFDLRWNSVGKSIDANHNNTTKCTSYDLENLLLGNNYITGILPSWLWYFKYLLWLDISNNRINGSIPVEIGCLSNLVSLDLSNNSFSGQIPTSIGNMESLEELELSHNILNGSIPESLGQCDALYFIFLSSNILQGALSEQHLANLSSLSNLDLSFNLLDMNFSSNWSPPFQLQQLHMNSCKVRSQFPRWIWEQTQLFSLDLSDNMMFGELPQWFPNINLVYINISHNQITGQIPYFSSSELSSIDLSYNLLSGQLLHDDPSVKKNVVGTPICQLPLLAFLDLQENKINGIIPDCWGNSELLQYINLSSNNISGNIPSSMGFIPNLGFLKLSNNALKGSIPPTLRSCSLLIILDLGDNQLVGNIPSNWDKTTHPVLQMLRLRENQLVGGIPPTLCSLPKLQLLDLAHNSLTGGIPRCFGNLTSMKSKSPASENTRGDYMVRPPVPIKYNMPAPAPYPGLAYHNVPYGLADAPIYEDPRDDSTTVVLKGAELQYSTTLKYVVNLDLSCNALIGAIPEEITNLSTLIGLNLSHNHLTGNIPDKIGEMRLLESLDLSNNNLSGTIPSSMSDLTSLIALNLSYNKLHGQIPTGHQLQVIKDPLTAYVGNPGLCGDPLPNKCNNNGKILPPEEEEEPHKDDNYLEKSLFYFVIFSGFATGFWGVVGSLLLKRRFRWALFQLVGKVTDYLYVQVMIRLNRRRN